MISCIVSQIYYSFYTSCLLYIVFIFFHLITKYLPFSDGIYLSVAVSIDLRSNYSVCFGVMHVGTIISNLWFTYYFICNRITNIITSCFSCLLNCFFKSVLKTCFSDFFLLIKKFLAIFFTVLQNFVFAKIFTCIFAKNP